MVEMAMFYVERAIIPKVGKPELLFMCSAHCLTVLLICVKFHANFYNGIRVMEWTQMIEGLTNRQTDTQNFGGYNIIPLPLFVAGYKMRVIGSHNITLNI